jgi:hypothetical protein
VSCTATLFFYSSLRFFPWLEIRANSIAPAKNTRFQGASSGIVVRLDEQFAKAPGVSINHKPFCLEVKTILTKPIHLPITPIISPLNRSGARQRNLFFASPPTAQRLQLIFGRSPWLNTAAGTETKQEQKSAPLPAQGLFINTRPTSKGISPAADVDCRADDVGFFA